MMRIVTWAVAATVFFTNGCCPKPKPPITMPPIVARVTTPCMEPMPELPELLLPIPTENVDEIAIPVATLRALLLTLGTLRGYLETQLARCSLAPTPQPTSQPTQ